MSLSETIVRLPTLDGFPIRQVDENSLEVQINAQQNLNELFDRLRQAGITVSGMRNKANRLEELFIQMLQKSA